jgi:hypothetical protein
MTLVVNLIVFWVKKALACRPEFRRFAFVLVADPRREKKLDSQPMRKSVENSH